MKRCTKCGAEKALAEFYSDKSRATGRSDGCKVCITKERAAYRETHREQLRAGAAADRKKTPERGCWHVMIARCHKPKTKAYPVYGGRGITVCARWRDSFEAFLADMGPRPSLKHSLDRFPNQTGNYEPGNVRWATSIQQARNVSTNRMVTGFGRTQCLSAWAEELGVKFTLLRDRLDLGWSAEDALSKAARPIRRNLTAFDETLSVAEWARRKGIAFETILRRLDAGWSAERAISGPAIKGRPLSGKRRSSRAA